MDASRHFPEVVQLLTTLENDNREIRIGRLKSYLFPHPSSLIPLHAAVGLDREVAIYAGDDDIAAGWAERTVDDKEVSVVDSLADHRLALNLDEERGGGALHQQLVQVERRLLVLFGGRGESRAAPCGHFVRSFHSRLPSEAELLRCIPTEPDTFAFLLMPSAPVASSDAP